MSLWNLVRDRLQPWKRGKEPMEIRRAILDEIEGEIQSIGMGKLIFPYDRVAIFLRASDPRQVAVLNAATKDGWDFQEDLEKLLSDRGCGAPKGLRVTAEVLEESEKPFGDRQVYLELSNAESRSEDLGEPVPLQVTVLEGEASMRVYEFRAKKIFVGRLERVLDGHGRLKRQNDLVFLDEGPLSASVSREHAVIIYDEDASKYRLKDEGSASGTAIFRAGRRFKISSADSRGVEIRDGDEISFGKTCVKIAYGSETRD